MQKLFIFRFKPPVTGGFNPQHPAMQYVYSSYTNSLIDNLNKLLSTLLNDRLLISCVDTAVQ